MGNLFKSCLGDLPEDEVDNFVYISHVAELSCQEISTATRIDTIETLSPLSVDLVNSTESFKLEEEQSQLRELSAPFRLAGGKYQRRFYDNDVKSSSYCPIVVELLLGTGLLVSVLIINWILSALWIIVELLLGTGFLVSVLLINWTLSALWITASVIQLYFPIVLFSNLCTLFGALEHNDSVHAFPSIPLMSAESESRSVLLNNFESFFGTYG